MTEGWTDIDDLHEVVEVNADAGTPQQDLPAASSKKVENPHSYVVKSRFEVVFLTLTLCLPSSLSLHSQSTEASTFHEIVEAFFSAEEGCCPHFVTEALDESLLDEELMNHLEGGVVWGPNMSHDASFYLEHASVLQLCPGSLQISFP